MKYISIFSNYVQFLVFVIINYNDRMKQKGRSSIGILYLFLQSVANYTIIFLNRGKVEQ